MLLKLAWRNIWRNKRRTAITAASIMFAVFFSVFMDAILNGAWDNLISNVYYFHYGFVQVHEKGFWEEQSLEKTFAADPQLLDLDETVPAIETVLPRLESFERASTGENTTGGMVIGIQPDSEKRMTKLPDRLIAGNYLSNDDKAIMLAKGVAERLSLEINDTIVLISQGYRGVNAAGKYPVKGIVEFGSPELNKQLTYLPLPEAQWFYGADNLLTSLAFELTSDRKIKRVVRQLKTELDTSQYEVMDWAEMLPDLVEARTLDSGGNVIVYIILYMIITFGIFGTILMMTKERSYEMGVLVSIGMRRSQLGGVIWLEIILLGILGAILGILVSLPLVVYFNINPLVMPGDYSTAMEQFGFEAVFPAALNWIIFAKHALVVLLITVLLGLYPMLKIQGLQPVKAMRS
ncbi:MAG: FtsX-like permease family protein [Bacteroidota bacterium]